MTPAAPELAQETVELVAARARAMRQADRASERLRANLQARHAAGEDLNLAQLARDVGVARSTLYLWLNGDAVETAA
jgi:DNA-binding phage protein